MDDNLKMIVDVFQDLAKIYRKFLDRSTQLERMPIIKEVSTATKWQYYTKNHMGLVNPPPSLVFYIDMEADLIGRPPICWELDICRDEDSIYLEGSVYTSLESRDHSWLKIERKPDTLSQFLIDFNEIADEVLKFSVPESLLNGSIKE